MIFGIGTDIVEVSRFEKWLKDIKLISKAFDSQEILTETLSVQQQCEYYASRYAAKEAFSKAMGTGLRGFSLKDVYVVKNSLGKPIIKVSDTLDNLIKEQCGQDYKIHVSLSHEKEYAIAYVIIEKGN